MDENKTVYIITKDDNTSSVISVNNNGTSNVKEYDSNNQQTSNTDYKSGSNISVAPNGSVNVTEPKITVNVINNSNGTKEVNASLSNGESIDVAVEDTTANVTQNQDGSVDVNTSGTNASSENYNTNVNIGSNGETNSTVDTPTKDSEVTTDNISQDVSIKTDGSVETKVSTNEVNTTITQNNNGSVDVNTTKSNGTSADISSTQKDTKVDISNTGTTITSSETNTTLNIDENGTVKTIIKTAESNTSVEVSKDLNVTTSIDTNGTVQNSITIGDTNVSITQNSNGDINASTNPVDVNKTIVNISKGNNTSVKVDENKTVYTIKKDDNTSTVITVNNDSSSNVKEYDSNNQETSNIDYKSGSKIDVNENGKVHIEKNTNKAPIITSNAIFNVDENSVLIGFVEANDPNGDGLKYYIVNGNDSTSFVLNETNGLLGFASGASPNYESGKVSYKVKVVVKDIYDLNDTQTITVNINDIFEDDNISDFDKDGIPDGLEGPISRDTDGDGIPDYRDTDSDGDGILDVNEFKGDTDGDSIPDFREKDSDNDGIDDKQDLDYDNDGILDSIEKAAKVNGVSDADVDNDGISNFQDKDSDGDGKPDSVELRGDIDQDGIENYLDVNDKGSSTPKDNGDGTQTSTFNKTAKPGDKGTTKITMPINKASTVINDSNNTIVSINDNNPNVDINITSTGGLNIDMNESNGSHKISIVNPGADVNISSDGNMTISTPSLIGANGKTCNYKLDIAYDGSDMVTKHYLNKGLNDEVITTVIMKIPNASIDISRDNIVKHLGSFTNNNSKDVNVTGLVECDGSISTITKIADVNGTFVAVNKPGATVIIDVNGNVDTTTPLEQNSTNPTTLQGLNFKIDSDSGDINASKVYKDSSSQEVTYSDAQIYAAGAKLNTAGGTSISEIQVDLSNTRLVTVDVKDTSNNTITSTTQIDNSVTDGNITRTSNGEDGSITTQVSSGSSTIQINNYIDGKAKHEVRVSGKTTEATSNLEGADVNVTSSGVTTSYQDTTSNLKAEVQATVDGKASHKIELNNGTTTEASSDIIGAQTTIDQDESGNAKVITTVETTNDNNQTVAIEIDALSDGSAIHKVEVNGYTTQATSQIAGAKTTVDVNGTVETNATVDSTNNVAAIVRALPDGTASHEVKGNGFDTIATSEIKGATTTIKSSGVIETEASGKDTLCTTGTEYVKAKVETNSDGTSITKFLKYDCNDNFLSEQITVANNITYPEDNNITIKENNGLVEIQTITKINDNLEF